MYLGRNLFFYFLFFIFVLDSCVCLCFFFPCCCFFVFFILVLMISIRCSFFHFFITYVNLAVMIGSFGILYIFFFFCECVLGFVSKICRGGPLLLRFQLCLGELLWFCISGIHWLPDV